MSFTNFFSRIIAGVGSVVKPAPKTPAIELTPSDVPVVADVKIETRLYPEATWRLQKAPYKSGHSMDAIVIRNKTRSWLEVRITPLVNDLVISKFGASGANYARMFGLKRKQVVKAGEEVVVTLVIGPATPPENAGQSYTDSFYNVYTEQHGKLVEQSIRIGHG